MSAASYQAIGAARMNTGLVRLFDGGGDPFEPSFDLSACIAFPQHWKSRFRCCFPAKAAFGITGLIFAVWLADFSPRFGTVQSLVNGLRHDQRHVVVITKSAR